MDKESRKIICKAFSNGKRHDFRLFKESKTHIHPQINALTDSGYLGLQKLHAKTQMPKKKSKKKPLSEEDKNMCYQTFKKQEFTFFYFPCFISIRGLKNFIYWIIRRSKFS